MWYLTESCLTQGGVVNAAVAYVELEAFVRAQTTANRRAVVLLALIAAPSALIATLQGKHATHAQVVASLCQLHALCMM